MPTSASFLEFTGLEDAATQARTLFRPEDNSVSDSLLEDYAKIAWFLSSDESFKAALTKVSAELWRHYRLWSVSETDKEGKLQPRMNNKFTTAIRFVASKYELGKGPESFPRIVLVGAVPEEQYQKWTGQGVFFKDMMDAKHGEYTHTLQWLAVALGNKNGDVGLTCSPMFLYKKISKFVAKKRNLLIPGGTGVGDVAGEKGLWSWVCDCFPRSMSNRADVPKVSGSIFSDTFRCPQRLMQYLFNETTKDHFVGTYLKYRYHRRRWLPNLEGDDLYKQISGGQTIKTAGTVKHEQRAGWKQIGGAFQEEKWYETSREKKVKNLVKVQFHGEEGYITDPTKDYQ
jgi:hypothetical protein